MKFSNHFILDGSFEEQDEMANDFLNSFTKEEIEESMSDKYAYLDED